jgi:dCMP deaminase
MQLELFNYFDHQMMSWAARTSEISRDPSTKTGCVLVSQGGANIGQGFNAFPWGVHQSDARLNDRAEKYPRTLHAEIRAIINAGSELFDPFTAYVHPCPPCAQCAAALIHAGCERVVAKRPTEEQISRWGESFAIMESMFQEANVRLDYIDH